MKTNRDLYLHACSIGASSANYPLLDYLQALRALASHERANPMSVELVAKLLTAARSSPPDASIQTGGPLAQGYASVDATLAHQIGDLIAMTANGQIHDPHAYFGINAPSGARWYNVNVVNYLECAARGSVGGYDADDVIVLIPPAPGESADSALDDLDDFDWELFADFLQCGQWFE